MKKSLFFLALLAAVASKAQWTNNYAVNTIASDASVLASNSQTTSDGKTYLSYWVSKPAPEYFKLYVQLLDENGNKLFGPTGMEVHAGGDFPLNMSSYTSIYNTAIDSNNNFYIAFMETGGSQRGFVHKISPAGTELWGSDGLPLGNAAYFPKVFTDKNSSNVYVSSFQNGLAVLGKYDASKTLLWPAIQTIPAPVSYNVTSLGEGAVLSDGSFLALFHAKTAITTANSNFFAQRYNSTTGAPMLAAPTKISDRTTFSNTNYTCVQDNDVLYLGYSGANSSRTDSFLQKIAADGSIPWGINGVDFATTNQYFEFNTSIAMNSGSNYIWALSRLTSSGQGSIGSFVQKFDKNTGARLLSDSAQEIYPVTPTSKQPTSTLKMLGEKPVFATIDSNYNGANATTISLTILNENTPSTFIIPGGSVGVGTSAFAKGNIYLNKGLNNQFIVTWTENRTGITSPYAQNYDFSSFLSTNDSVKNDKNDLSVYPNPVRSVLHIQSKEDISSLTIYNAAGQLINASKETRQLDFSSFEKGVYWVRILDKKGNESTKKVIKN